MAYGIIENGVIVDAKEATPAFAAAQGWVALTGGAGIGWTFKDGTFSPPVTPAPTMDAIMAERDRRIQTGFPFLGKVIQSRPEDRENIIGASVLAGQALAFAGAQPGDLRWHGGDSDFAWITEDNSLLTLDALAVIQLGKVAAAHKSGLIFAAKAIKERVDAGEDVGDITADALWS